MCLQCTPSGLHEQNRWPQGIAVVGAGMCWSFSFHVVFSVLVFWKFSKHYFSSNCASNWIYCSLSFGLILRCEWCLNVYVHWVWLRCVTAASRYCSSAQSQRGAAGLSGLVKVDKNSAVIKLLNAWKINMSVVSDETVTINTILPSIYKNLHPGWLNV